MEEFIQKLEVYRDSNDRDEQDTFYFMKRAYKFAKENRAIGLGVLGWHSLLQSKMLPFESVESMKLNTEIFKLIRNKSYAASKEMAEVYGEPEVLRGYGRRNATTMAIAPTTSSSFILGQVSQGIEPIWSNCYVKDVAKIKVTIKNSLLEELLERKSQNTRDVWESIRNNDGSVQQLAFLSDAEKEVFKTFPEINQMNIIQQAAARQRYIDQGQSLNIMLHPDTPVKDINKIYVEAWKLGIKTLYYQHSMNAAQQFNRKLLQCEGCEA
jgi:ribonucleoside-diphosphate reductase alpha chain